MRRRAAELCLALGILGLPHAAPQARTPGQARPGVWISCAEVQALPDHGEAWETVLAAARRPLPRPDIAERDSDSDVLVLARALVAVRTGDEVLRHEVHEAVARAMGTELEGDVLALARNLPGYVIAADLVGLPEELESSFRAWLEDLLDLELEGQTLRRIHERRPNNWGTHAGGARAVIASYLDDGRELERVAAVFRGWLGERAHHDGFEFGALDWQADPQHPVGINPCGAERDGHSLDGVLGDDQRRGGAFQWPPPRENYVYEALQGALLQAVVLDRAGYPAWEWGDRALLRAARWLVDEARFPAEGDDAWQPDVFNHVYGTDFATHARARPGKNVGWTAWTLGCSPAAGERRDAR